MVWPHQRRILWLLAAATLIPIGVLSWLGSRILQQDRDAERLRQREALDVGAGRVALDIERRLQDVEDGLAHGEGVVLLPGGPVSTPAHPLLYQSTLFALDDVRESGFAEAEAAEHQRKDLAAAAAAYRMLARSSTAAVRAAALLRLGGVLKKGGDLSGALLTYADLQTLGVVSVAGQPAALVARHARCRVLEKAGEPARLRTEALEFARVLYSGGWRIDRPTFENYQDELRRWGAPPPPVASVRALGSRDSTLAVLAVG